MIVAAQVRESRAHRIRLTGPSANFPSRYARNCNPPGVRECNARSPVNCCKKFDVKGLLQKSVIWLKTREVRMKSLRKARTQTRNWRLLLYCRVVSLLSVIDL